MPDDYRIKFSLKALLAVIVIVVLLFSISVQLIQSARDSARRNQCGNKLKQIGLALHRHHDAHNRFPALTNQRAPGGSANVWATAPGATFAPNGPPPNGYTQTPASAAGYSWIVMILPYMDEAYLSDNIARVSADFTYEAFSDQGENRERFETGVQIMLPFQNLALDEVSCPSYEGNPWSTASSGTDDPPVSIPAYTRQSKYYSPPNCQRVSITNYFALSATHLACMATDPSKFDAANANVMEPPNGVLVPGNGMSMKDVLDGTSKTLIVCETREPAVNSWYDGTVCWTVGANPNASSQPIRNTGGLLMDNPRENDWIFPPGTTNPLGLNYGPVPNKNCLFAPSGTAAAQTQPVSWGPSSDHGGGVVMHLSCDGSVQAITAYIDPTLYVQFISRSGREFRPAAERD